MNKDKIIDYFIEDTPPTDVLTPEQQQQQAQQQQQTVTVVTPAAPVQEQQAAPVTDIPPATGEPDKQPIRPAKDNSKFKYLTKEELLEQTQKDYINPVMALVKANAPKLDEKHQERLAKAMAINSAGDALKQVFTGFYGARGATIPVEENKFVPEAYAEYMNNLKDFNLRKDAHNNNKLSAMMQGLNIYNSNLNAERAIEHSDFNADKQQNNAEYMQGQQYEEAERQAKKAFDNNLQLFDKQTAADLTKMAKQHGYAVALEKMQEKHSDKQLERQITAGRFNSSSKSGGGITRSKPNSAFTYRNNRTGKQVTLKPGQDDIINAVLSQAMSDEDIMLDYGDILKKWADGDMKEDDAKTLMGMFADRFVDVDDAGNVTMKTNDDGSAGYFETK